MMMIICIRISTFPELKETAKRKNMLALSAPDAISTAWNQWLYMALPELWLQRNISSIRHRQELIDEPNALTILHIGLAFD